jgi:hypothetical protein
MDANQFDELVARLAEGPSRRETLKGIVGGALASIGIGAALDDDAEAKGKGHGGGGGHKGHGGGGGHKGHGGGGGHKGHDGGGHDANAAKHKHHHKKKKKCKGGKKHCGSKKKCFDLQTSNTNCGACKFACLSTEQCVAGVCTPVS